MTITGWSFASRVLTQTLTLLGPGYGHFNLNAQVSSLLDEKLRDSLTEDVAEEYQEIREEYYASLKVLVMVYAVHVNSYISQYSYGYT